MDSTHQYVPVKNAHIDSPKDIPKKVLYIRTKTWKLLKGPSIIEQAETSGKDSGVGRS